MFSTRIYLKIVFQVTIIVIVAGLGLAGIVSGKAIILGCVTLLIALWLTGVLVYFLNASNRRIQLFLDAIEDNESMLYFPENTGPEEQRQLHTAFNRIHSLMTESKQKEFERELLRKEYESYDKLMHVLTHEIMNSIAPIVSLSGTLLSYYRNKETTKSCDEITDATIRKTIRGLEEPGTKPHELHPLLPPARSFADTQSQTLLLIQSGPQHRAVVPVGPPTVTDRTGYPSLPRRNNGECRRRIVLAGTNQSTEKRHGSIGRAG